MIMNDNKIQWRIRDAIENGETENAFSLIQNTPDCLHMDTPFGPWLHVAADFGNLEMIKRLIASGVEIGRRCGTFEGNALNEAAPKLVSGGEVRSFEARV
jgi:hypothetical protein